VAIRAGESLCVLMSEVQDRAIRVCIDALRGQLGSLRSHLSGAPTFSSAGDVVVLRKEDRASMVQQCLVHLQSIEGSIRKAMDATPNELPDIRAMVHACTEGLDGAPAQKKKPTTGSPSKSSRSRSAASAKSS